MSYVIAIAGPPGSGKSALAHALAQVLGGAEVLEFDRYEQATARSVDDLSRWLKDGADFNALAAPGLREDLVRLRAASTPKYLLFEMPLGREHAQTAPLIDFLLWIDLPLDVALARKLRQITAAALRSPAPAEQGKAIAWLNGYLDGYLTVVRQVLVVQHERVRPGADVFVDGLADFADIVAQTGGGHPAADAVGRVLRGRMGNTQSCPAVPPCVIPRGAAHHRARLRDSVLYQLIASDERSSAPLRTHGCVAGGRRLL